MKLQDLLKGEIDFVPQLDPQKPQLLFPTVPVQIVVQALKEKTDNVDDIACEGYENGLRASQFVDQDRENVLALHHTALHIRADIRDSPSYNNCSSVNIDDVAKIITESLFMFLSVILTGEPGEIEVDARTRMLSLSIAQDIVHAVSKGKALTPKHVGLGMTLHQATCSKDLVNIFHKAGHGISYS